MHACLGIHMDGHRLVRIVSVSHGIEHRLHFLSPYESDMLYVEWDHDQMKSHLEIAIFHSGDCMHV